MNFETFVLAAVTADLTVEPQAREHADAVEFRLDLADDPLAQLDSYNGELPLIATNRVEWEGGKAPNEQDRIDALERAVEHPAVEAVDIEFAALRTGGCAGLPDHARAHDAAIIVSMHDFERTPDREAMYSMLAGAAEHGDVAKLAVTASSRGDVLALLNATHDATADGHRVATMAMGEAGRHSRAVAPLYGSKIGYAPVSEGDATAPGQYDLATLRHLVEQLDSTAD
jgi:3-dehydroquinate dehydratase-1